MGFFEWYPYFHNAIKEKIPDMKVISSTGPKVFDPLPISIRGREHMGYLKKLPIRVQMSMLVLLIIAIVIFIIFTNYFKAAKVVEKKNNEYFTETISQMNQTLSSNTDVVKRLLQNISYNSSIVQQYLNETNHQAKFREYTQLKSYISDMIGMKDGIVDIALSEITVEIQHQRRNQ